jgi:hypothetical protein
VLLPVPVAPSRSRCLNLSSVVIENGALSTTRCAMVCIHGAASEASECFVGGANTCDAEACPRMGLQISDRQRPTSFMIPVASEAGRLCPRKYPHENASILIVSPANEPIREGGWGHPRARAHAPNRHGSDAESYAVLNTTL